MPLVFMCVYKNLQGPSLVHLRQTCRKVTCCFCTGRPLEVPATRLGAREQQQPRPYQRLSLYQSHYH